MEVDFAFLPSSPQMMSVDKWPVPLLELLPQMKLVPQLCFVGTQTIEVLAFAQTEESVETAIRYVWKCILALHACLHFFQRLSFYLI